MLVDPMLILAGDYLAQDGGYLVGTSWVPRGGWIPVQCFRIPLVSGGFEGTKTEVFGTTEKKPFRWIQKQGEHRQYKA